MQGKGRNFGQGGSGRRGPGMGPGQGGTGKGFGRMGGAALGPGGYCVCPACGTKVKHKRGIPCNQMTCPKCGTPLTRE